MIELIALSTGDATNLAAPTVAVVIGSVVTYFFTRISRKLDDQSDTLHKQDQHIAEIHVLVNNRLTEALSEIVKLTMQRALNEPSQPHQDAAKAAQEDLGSLQSSNDSAS